MENKILEIKNTAKEILDNTSIFTSNNDADLIKYLAELEKREIHEDEVELINRTLNNIKDYFKIKNKMKVEINDYDYLRELAESLRNQKVRAEDEVILGEPVFKIVSEDKSQEYYFLTKKGAESFLEANSTSFDEIEIQEVDSEERRKENIYDVKANRNIELDKIIEIIKRNF